MARGEARLDRLETRLDGGERRRDSIEKRVDRLEVRLDGLDARLRAVERVGAANGAKLDALAAQMASLTGQLAAKLPSWWQVPATIEATVSLLAGLAAVVRRLQLLQSARRAASI